MYRLEDYPELKKSIYLTGRDMGASKRLKGKVGIISCFMRRNATEFSDKTTAQYYTELNKAIVWLEKEAARYGVYLKMQGYHYHVDVPKNADPAQGYQLVRDFMNMNTADEAQAYFEKKMGYDETPFILVYDAYARSFAFESMSMYKVHIDENSTVFKNNDGYSWRTIAHELLHQFGAFDFYYPDAVKECAKRYLGDSIMSQGNEAIDDLTAYLIGWKDTISAGSYWFLHDTLWMDEDKYNKAVEEAWKHKW